MFQTVGNQAQSQGLHRWLADIPALPGVTAYGRTKKQATAAAFSSDAES